MTDQTQLFTDTRLHDELLGLARIWHKSEIVAAVVALWPDECRPLFPARFTDPATSQNAAIRHASPDPSRFRRHSIKHLVLVEFRNSDLTALDAARAATGQNDPLRTETARKRVAELADAGLIETTGRTRRAEGSPDESNVLTITAAGIHALDQCERFGWSR